MGTSIITALTSINGGGATPIGTNPAFVAYPSANILNITGDGTLYNIVFDTADINVGSHYVTGTGIFTASVDGMYSFNTSLRLNGIWTGNDDGTIVQVEKTGSSPNTYLMYYQDQYEQRVNVAGGFGELMFSVSTRFKMLATETAVFQLQVDGTSKIVDIKTGSTISGRLDQAL